MADVLIAGAGIAGSSLAILLARRGLSVEILERCEFPREKPCGEGLMPGGVAVLERMGLQEAVGGSPFYGVRYHFGSHTVAGRFPRVAGFPPTGRGQRRRYFDAALFRAAAETAGVTVRTGVIVDGPLVEKGRVAGLLMAGELRRAALVVGADGAHSRIRRLLGLDLPAARKRVGVRRHFRLRQQQPPWVDVFVGSGHELYVTPLPGNEILVAALADACAIEENPKENIERAYYRWCRAEATLAARLEGAEPVTPLLCTSPLSGRARCGVAPGLVLLGDAAGFVDPITGGGMTQALMTAELLAACFPPDFRQSDEWLWGFERQRQKLLRDYRRLTQAVLWLAGRPQLASAALFGLRAAPGLLSHLIGVSAGMRPLVGSPRKWRNSLSQAPSMGKFV